MIELSFVYDNNKQPDAKAPPPYEPLAWFLSSDVQGSQDYCREILDHVLDLQMGRKDKWEVDGNRFSLGLTKNGAVIEGFWEKDIKLEVPIEDFVRALTGWLHFLEQTRV